MESFKQLKEKVKETLQLLNNEVNSNEQLSVETQQLLESYCDLKEKLEHERTNARGELETKRIQLEQTISDLKKEYQILIEANNLAETYNRKLRHELETWQKKLKYEQRISGAISNINKQLEIQLQPESSKPEPDILSASSLDTKTSSPNIPKRSLADTAAPSFSHSFTSLSTLSLSRPLNLSNSHHEDKESLQRSLSSQSATASAISNEERKQEIEDERDIRLWRIRSEVENAKKSMKEKYVQNETTAKDDLWLKMKQIELELDLRRQFEMQLESRLGEQRQYYENQLQQQLESSRELKRDCETRLDQVKKESDELLESRITLEKEKIKMEYLDMICKTYPQFSTSKDLMDQNFKLQSENELLRKQIEELSLQVDELKKGPSLESLENKIESNKNKSHMQQRSKKIEEDTTEPEVSPELKIQILLEKIEDETQARTSAEEQAMKLEDQLIEANIRIEEWKHHFLMETQERAQMDNERKEMQQELEGLKKKIGLLLKQQTP